MKDIYVISIISHIEIAPPPFEGLNITVSILASPVIDVDEKHQIQTLHKHNSGSVFYLIDNNQSGATPLYTPLEFSQRKTGGQVFHQSPIDESITLKESIKLGIEPALQDIINGGESNIDKALALLHPYTGRNEPAPMKLISSEILDIEDVKLITIIIHELLLDIGRAK